VEGAVFAMTFNAAELVYAVGLLGNSPRLLEDPFSGWPAECIEKAQQQAQESLVERNFIQVQPDGRFALDTTVAGLVGALAFAESILTVTRLLNAKEQPSVLQVHFASGLIVAHEEREGMHHLTAIRDKEIVTQRLKEYAHLAEQPAPSVPPCTLRSSDLYEARCVAVVEEEAASTQILTTAGAPAAAASSLARAMADTVCQSVLLALAWKDGEHRELDRFTVLEGESGLWLIQPTADGPDLLEAMPCDAVTATNRVREIVTAVAGTR
jgi:hypothetical protein